jgi:hypothetical protein
MKFYTNLNQLLLFLICSAFYSCKSDESIENEVEKSPPVFQMTDVGPETVPLIDKEVERIVKEMNDYEVKGPITVKHVDGLAEMTLYNLTGVPVVIKTQKAQTEQWFFLYNRRVIYLRELIYQDDSLTENKFYYSNTGMINATQKEAENQSELSKVNSSKFRKSFKKDYRLDVREVNFLVIGFLYGDL